MNRRGRCRSSQSPRRCGRARSPRSPPAWFGSTLGESNRGRPRERAFIRDPRRHRESPNSVARRPSRPIPSRPLSPARPGPHLVAARQRQRLRGIAAVALRGATRPRRRGRGRAPAPRARSWRGARPPRRALRSWPRRPVGIRRLGDRRGHREARAQAVLADDEPARRRKPSLAAVPRSPSTTVSAATTRRRVRRGLGDADLNGVGPRSGLVSPPARARTRTRAPRRGPRIAAPAAGCRGTPARSPW